MGLQRTIRKRKNLAIIGAGFLVLLFLGPSLLGLITTKYPTGHEVGTKINDFSSTRYGSQVHYDHITQGDKYWDKDNFYTASECQFDADPWNERNPDVYCHVGQPEHGVFENGVFTPNDDNSKYSDQIVRDFWIEADKTVERHVFDQHFYRFTIDIKTDLDQGGSSGNWWAEARWTEEKAKDDNIGKEQVQELLFQLWVGIKAQPWSYSVNPTVGELENYTVDSAQVWTGILSVKIENVQAWTDKNVRQSDGSIIPNPNDPVTKYPHTAGSDGWYVIGNPSVESLGGTNLFLEMDWSDLETVSGRPSLPSETQVGGLGMKAWAGLAGDIDFSLGGDDIRQLHPYNCYVHYEILVETLNDQGFVMSAPQDAETEPPAGEEEPPAPAPQPKKPWDYVWDGVSWAVNGVIGTIKGIGGFVGGIIENLWTVIMILILILPIIFIVFLGLYLLGKRPRRKK